MQGNDEQLIARIKQWQSKLTGLPDEAFDGFDVEQQIELASKWFASHVIAEQMAALTLARLMVQDDVSIKDLRWYLGSSEAKKKPLGRFNYVAGIGEWAASVAKVWLPLLRQNGYRPCFPAQVARQILLIAEEFIAIAGMSASSVADTVYKQGLSPYIAKRTIGTLRSFANVNPIGARQMLQGLALAREQAVDAISGVPEVEAVVDAIDEPWHPSPGL